jgi:hypothetical protein
MNADRMFDPPNCYSYDAIEIKEKVDCEHCCESQAKFLVSLETDYGWTKPVKLCEGCKDKELEG